MALSSSCLVPCDFSTFSRRKFSGFTRKCCSKFQRSAAHTDEATVLEVPCLPFTTPEVLVPSSVKTLHLYEARFLSLLEEAVRKCDQLFVHIVVESTGTNSNEYAMKYGCLSHIQSIRRLNVGALVTIRGVGRIRVLSVSQIEPFMRAVVVPLKDEPPEDPQVVSSSVEVLKKALADVQQLQIKLKTSGSGKLQTALAGALEWAESSEFPEKLSYFVPQLQERLSFAALQPITGATPGELQMLLQQRLSAMESMNTHRRLSSSIEYAQQSRSYVAAKLAIQSLQL